MKIRLAHWLWLSLGIITLTACGGSEPPELAQAADAVQDMLKSQNLSRSMFAAAFPNGAPSQYVSYFFSDMGVAEWPPSEAFADELDIEQMKAIGETMFPANVALVRSNPDPALGQQLVLRADDARGVIIVEGYVDPGAEPVLSREWNLPQVDPAPGVEEIYRANKEMGLSDQSN